MGGSRSGFCLWMLLSQWPFRVGVASGAEKGASSRGIVQAPKCFGSFCGKGRVLFSAKGTPKKRDSRAQQWVPSTGIHTI